jgi:hypothetical protein
LISKIILDEIKVLNQLFDFVYHFLAILRFGGALGPDQQSPTYTSEDAFLSA